jgi:hypothetical protein
MYIHTYTYIYTHIHTYIYIHAYIHTYTYIYKSVKRELERQQGGGAGVLEQDVFWAPAAMCAFRAGALNIARAGVTLGTFVPVKQVLLYQYSKQTVAICALRTSALNIARARVTLGTRWTCFAGTKVQMRWRLEHSAGVTLSGL